MIDFNFSYNFFELFGLPMQFNIDTDALSKRYRELQRIVHPDRYASASDQERRHAVQYAAKINEAYTVLNNPINRLGYILELNNCKINHEKDTVTDSNFLLEQMELREKLNEISNEVRPEGDLYLFQQALSSQLDIMIDKTVKAIERGEFQLAKQNYLKLQFMKKLQDEGNQLEVVLSR